MTTDDDGPWRGSAVMRAGTVIDRERLLDELEFRLIRCTAGQVSDGGGIRMGGVLSAGEQSHRIARNETRGFWNEHRLSDCKGATILDFVDGLLSRSPRYLAWALVPLLTELLPKLRSERLIERIEEFVTEIEPVGRVVRDAITLTILVKWLGQLPEASAVEHLVELCQSPNPCRIRMGCIGLGAYVGAAESLSVEAAQRAFDASVRVGARVDPETAIAVGWALRELLSKSPEDLDAVFEKRVALLSRQAFRTSVERMAPEVRAKLTRLWRSGRLRRSGPPSIGPHSTARRRKLPAG